MANKDLRHLSRAELIEIIYSLQTHEQELLQEIDELKTRLSNRTFNVDKVGSLAEAVVSVSGIIDAAQKAADDYLRGIRAVQEQAELDAAQIVRGAEEKAAMLLRGVGEFTPSQRGDTANEDTEK